MNTDKFGVGECWYCENWKSETWIMNKYGEGMGICKLENDLRFCTHKCPFCTPREYSENKHDFSNS